MDNKYKLTPEDEAEFQAVQKALTLSVVPLVKQHDPVLLAHATLGFFAALVGKNVGMAQEQGQAMLTELQDVVTKHLDFALEVDRPRKAHREQAD